MEASKGALETELQQQKDSLTSLEEKLQEQKQLTEAQQEAKVALEAKLQETQAAWAKMFVHQEKGWGFFQSCIAVSPSPFKYSGLVPNLVRMVVIKVRRPN